MTEKPEFPYMTCPAELTEIAQTMPADLDLVARLEALQQQLREEQSALPKPLSTLHIYISLRMGYAIQQIQFAREALISEGWDRH